MICTTQFFEAKIFLLATARQKVCGKCNSSTINNSVACCMSTGGQFDRYTDKMSQIVFLKKLVVDFSNNKADYLELLFCRLPEKRILFRIS